MTAILVTGRGPGRVGDRFDKRARACRLRAVTRADRDFRGVTSVLRTRSPLQAYGIGLVHGMGGSAGVGVLLLGGIHSHVMAVVSLGLFALFTAISMAVLSTGLGLTLATGPARRSFDALAPALGSASLAFGVWYVLGALHVATYVF